MSDWVKDDKNETASGSIAEAVAATAAEVTALAEYEYVPELDVHFDKTSGYCFKQGLHDFHHASTHYTYHFDDQSLSWQCSYDPEWDRSIGCSASLDAYVLLSELVDRIEINENTESSHLEREDASSPVDEMLPCIRAVVMESESMPYGQLFIVTVDGAAIACCDDDLGPTVVDENCNKALCRIRFNSERKRFQLEKILTEGGDEEGELVENRSVLVILNDSVIEGREMVDISHQDRLVVDCGDDLGYILLSLHIHKATNTCAGCEPGLLLSTSSIQSMINDNAEPAPTKTKAELERDRRRELKRIKRKYALSYVDYVQNEKPKNAAKNYTDRADIRRRTVGSDLPESAIEAMSNKETPSNSTPVGEQNRGFKMLEKMGWKKGTGIGKKEDGIQQPICPVAHMDSSGLGVSSAARVAVGDQGQALKRFKWSKAALRYHQLDKNPTFEEFTS